MNQKEIDLEVKSLFNRDQYSTVTILDEMIRDLTYVKMVVKDPETLHRLKYAHKSTIDVAHTINAIFNDYIFS